MKKLPTLHILNGDTSVPAFKIADIPGQVLVWREILACGPAVYKIPEEAFWQMRQRYITETYQETQAGYQEKVLNELTKLQHASHFFEVVLWFDQDLVCQINLLYLLHFLSRQRPAVVSVCTSSHSKSELKKHEELQNLFENRKMLEPSELDQASELWQLYAGTDPIALQAYIQDNKVFSEHLKQAIELHLQRFPDENTLLGKPQELLLKAVEAGASTISEVQQKFWKQAPEYGFGDWQLEALLKELTPDLIQRNENNVALTEAGKDVLHGNSKFAKPLTYWLGGVQLKQQNPDFCRDSVSERVKIYGSKLSPN